MVAHCTQIGPYILDSMVVTFNVRDMFISRHNIYNGTKICNVTSHGFELIVGKDNGDTKATNNVNTKYYLQMLDDSAVFIVIQFSSGAKFDVLRDGVEKWDPTDLHNIKG